MTLGFAEDMDCEEIRKRELIGDGARNALNQLLNVARNGGEGVYVLMGEYGTGKTFILRKLSTMVDIHVINLRRGADISCSKNVENSSMYVIDNLEMLLRKPLQLGDSVRNIMKTAKLLVASISTSGGPIYGGSIVNIDDILMRLQGAKKIHLEVNSKDAEEIIKSAGITISVPPLMKTPGLVIRAFGGRRNNDDTYTLI